MSQKDSVAESSPQKQLSMEEILDRIHAQSEELDILQKKQTRLACLGVILILAILCCFLWKMIDFGKSIDRQALAEKALSMASAELLQNNDVLAMKADLQEVFVPALQKELSVKLEKSMPVIKGSFEKEKDRLVNHLQVNTRDRIMKRLQTNFSDMGKRLAAKHCEKVSDAELELALYRTQTALLADAEKQLNKRLDDAMTALEDLNATCQRFKTLPEYKHYVDMPREDLEAQTVESFLELWIYHIDPARGDLPAAQKGGI